MAERLDDHHLRYLVEAIRRGSVRAAADVLGVNPSVVSRQIADLENELGIALLERLPRGVRATEAGEYLATHFRQQMTERDDAIARIREMRGLMRGHISLIIGGGFVSDIMSGPLTRFWERHPRITLTVDIGGADEITQAVAEDRFHLGMGFNVPPHPRVRVVEAVTQPLALITRPDQELTRREAAISLEEIARYPLALLPVGSGARQRIALAEQAEGLVLSPRLNTSSLEMLRKFVRDGHGLTLLPAFAINAESAAGTLVALPIRSAILDDTQSQVVTRLGRALPAAAVELLRFLVREMRAFRG
ncbi:MAG: LysR family transcriptional regulator [Methylobacterium sp.]|nr:MAG: LysR family transcriptional regulator [Methylobacterium sp.]